MIGVLISTISVLSLHTAFGPKSVLKDKLVNEYSD